MGTVSNVRNRTAESLKELTITATPSAALTASQVENGIILATHASAAIAITLPTASARLRGKPCRIYATGAATVTVVAGADSAGTAGFGSLGSGYDTLTLVAGGGAEVMVVRTSAGVYQWVYIHATVAA